MKKLTLLVALLLIATLPSCGMKDAAGKISLELKRVKVTGFSNSGMDAVVYMQVNNPNWFGLKISDLRYQILMGDEELARGGLQGEIEVPANGSVVAELPLAVRLEGKKFKLADIINSGSDYQVRGEVVFKTWFGGYTVPFDTKKHK